ncbi:uncharacterized protein PpBr36_06052 [Pyricularia pennisetigena]|uniref:uncharacterized protein n=1 Tax=Pyricularia pennisetigena TaxID=1578925 RepID=UPI00114D92E5|nr:uncharacterized protein PpBr36_06052 [Pyricularia pennisetigena]TLS22758.1 hypothetical protein PpBr36_06052 [Pyricularia pennisetigena]
MPLLPGRNKLLPRQDSQPPPNTTACSGWDCLQQSQQFGVIFSIVLSVLTFVFLYWFLFWRRRKPLTKKHEDDDPGIVEVELRSLGSSQTTAVIRFAPGDPGDVRKDNRRGTVFRLHKELPQSDGESPIYPGRNDRHYVLECSSVPDLSHPQPPGVKGCERAQLSTKQGPSISTPARQNLASNQAIEHTNAKHGPSAFCDQRHTISHQQRMLYMNQLGTKWYNQQSRIPHRLHTMPTAMPGVQLGQVPMVHCYPYIQPYMAPAYTHMPASTPAAPMVPSQPLQATHFSQTPHEPEVVPIVQPFQPPFPATTTAQAKPSRAHVPRTTAPRTHHTAPTAQTPVYRDAPWWRKWVWRYPTTVGRASTIDSDSHRSRSRSTRSSSSRSSNHTESPDQDRSASQRSPVSGKDVRPTSRERGGSPIDQRQEERSTKLSQKSSKEQPQPELSPDFDLSDLGSLPSHTTLDSYLTHDSHINEFSRDKILAHFERAKSVESKSPRIEPLGSAEVIPSSSKSTVKDIAKDSVIEGCRREPSDKQPIDKILITISPPTSLTRSAKTAVGISESGDSSELNSTGGRSARLYPVSASKRVLPGGKICDRKDTSGVGVERETKEQFLRPKEIPLCQDVSVGTDERPVLYRVDNDGDETASLGTSTQARASSSSTTKSAAYNDEASIDTPRRRIANRDREVRNLEMLDRESHEIYPEDFQEGSDSASFRPRPPRPFTTEAMSFDADRSSAGGAKDEPASKNRSSSKQGRGEADSMEVQSSPEVVGFYKDMLLQPPSRKPGRKKLSGDSSEFFRFRGSDDNVENK